ncbi:hypothetical protein DN062_07340 [Nitrincola tibetensis]|uniref:DUF3306 domain-containing protein n=1 Tax=Nitrincola tibetensis TaxID=2219697 RepID=A0A364NN97_9GAMM|nr:DUF3306 domain-containing protein [Nitrincola tibetensis]RAU18579.1 hypothetical protein DN062_07340 [Nitrincola tibetensis]
MTDGFLSRWSRLKRRELDESSSPASELDSSVAIEDTLIESDMSVVITDVEEPESPPHSSEDLPGEEVVLTDIDMPDLSTITSKSDMSMFFSSGVSAELKKKALRQFFHQPEFNVRDPLDDYALDYSNPTKLILKPGEVVRGWAKERMDEAMEKARDVLLSDNKVVDSEGVYLKEEGAVDQSNDGTDEAVLHSKNEQGETK